MGLSSYLSLGLWPVITLLIIGVTPIRSFRGGVIRRVISPVMSSYYFS